MENPVLGTPRNQEEIWSLCNCGMAWSGEGEAVRRQRSAVISSSVKNSEGKEREDRFPTKK